MPPVSPSFPAWFCLSCAVLPSLILLLDPPTVAAGAAAAVVDLRASPTRTDCAEWGHKLMAGEKPRSVRGKP